MTTATDTPVWLTPVEVRARTGRGAGRIREACRDGRLHGHQRKPNGPWIVADACADAYMAGLTPAAQAARCPCRGQS